MLAKNVFCGTHLNKRFPNNSKAQGGAPGRVTIWKWVDGSGEPRAKVEGTWGFVNCEDDVCTEALIKAAALRSDFVDVELAELPTLYVVLPIFKEVVAYAKANNVDW